MKIVHKLILGAVLPAALIASIGLVTNHLTRRVLTSALENNTLARSRALLDEVDRLMATHVAEWRSYALSAVVQEALASSNATFDHMSSAQEQIDSDDDAWRATPAERNTPLMDRLFSNDLAIDMKNRLFRLDGDNTFPLFREVFVTNRYGANIAQTNRTSDYRQDDEDWWRLAKKNGIYVGDVGFDESAGVNSTDICLRIDDAGGRFAGVLKVVLNIAEPIAILDARAAASQPSNAGDPSLRYILFTRNLKVIHDTANLAAFVSDGAEFFADAFGTSDAASNTEDRVFHDSARDRVTTFGVSHGHANYAGLGWILMSSYDANSVFRPMRELQRLFLIVSIGAAAATVLGGGFIAMRLSNRINILKNAALVMGKQEQFEPVNVGGADELTQLADTFNNMATDLHRSHSALHSHVEAVQHKYDMLTVEIGERLRAENALENQREQLRAILASVDEAIVTADEDGLIHLYNKAAERIFGYSLDEAIGLHISVLAPSLFSAQRFERLQESGDAEFLGRTNESQGVHKNGASFPIHVAATSVAHDDQRHLVALMRDLRDEKAKEAQRTHAQKLESIGQLAAGIAHEINTPIQYVGDNTHFVQENIVALLKLLDQYAQFRESTREGKDVSAQIEAIETATEDLDLPFVSEEIPKAITQTLDGVSRVTEIVRAMKEFSHPGGVEPTLTNLNNAIKSTITVCRNRWKYVADLNMDFQDDLPMAPCLIGEFNQVMLNLIVNAADAIAEKLGEGSEQKGEIAVSTRQEGDSIVIRVKDTGGGIPADIVNRIFDPFFTTKTVGRGTGQGLAISHDVIVNKHGGEIECDSKVNVGTTFIVRLPIAGKPAAQSAEVSKEDGRKAA